MAGLVCREEEKFQVVEVPVDFLSNPSHFEALKSLLGKAEKKTRISLAPDFKTDRDSLTAFLKEIEGKAKDRVVFVAPDALDWDWGWKAILHSGMPVVNERKAALWAEREGLPQGKMTSTVLEELIYLKLEGNYIDCLPSLMAAVKNAGSFVKMEGETLEKPVPMRLNEITTWTFVKGGLIFDFADLLFLDSKFLSVFKKILKEYGLRPDLPGVYFVTEDFLQSWILKQRLVVPHCEIGNIVRVVSSDDPNVDLVVQGEANTLAAHCRQSSPPQYLLFHQVQKEHALQALRLFHPDLVLLDHLEEMEELRLAVEKEKIFPFVPGSGSGTGVLGPGEIVQDYPAKYFGDYILSCYKNRRGFPNQTYFYYMDPKPECVQRGIDEFIAAYGPILKEEQRNFLNRIKACEIEETFQGTIILSLFQQKILRLEASLPLSNPANESFLEQYSDWFPEHHAVLCKALRLFIKATPNVYVESHFDLVDSCCELSIKKSSFWIESTVQTGKCSLVVKSNPHEELEHRCFQVFSLLAGSNQVFRRLPEKEVLIELIALLWDNYRMYPARQGAGFLITLHSSVNRSKITIFQQSSNRVMIRASEKEGELQISCGGEFVYNPNTQRHLFKIMGFLFPSPSRDPGANPWHFACCEAIHQVVANTEEEQVIKVDFMIEGDHWRSTFTSSALKENEVAPNSRQIMKKGVDKMEISADGRQIVLVKNPLLKEQRVRADDEDDLSKTDDLQSVEAEKAKEKAERDLRIQGIYREEIRSKYDFAKDSRVHKEFQGTRLFDIQGKKGPDGKRVSQGTRAWITRALYAIAAVLAVGFVSFGVAMSRSVAPTTSIEQTPPPDPVRPHVPDSQAPSWTLEGKFLDPQRFEIAGKCSAWSLWVTLEDEKGLVIHQKELFVVNGEYRLTLQLPSISSVHVISRVGKEERRNSFFRPPEKALPAVKPEDVIAWCQELERTVVDFLGHRNYKRLKISLDTWEKELQEKIVFFSGEGQGQRGLVELLENLSSLENKLELFLFSDFASFPGIRDFPALVVFASAQQEVDRMSRQFVHLWGEEAGWFNRLKTRK